MLITNHINLMRRLFLWVLASALCLQSFAQLAEPGGNPTAQKYAAFISPEDARKHLTILASDEFEGRETGRPGATKAANYISGEFKKLGLTAPVNNSYFQNVPLIETSFIVSSFIVNQSRLANWKDFYFAGSPGGGRTLEAKEIVFVGYGISSEFYDDLENIDIAGKIVLVINSGEPVKEGISAVTKTTEQSNWSRDRNMRIRYLRSKMPALILAVSPEVALMLPINEGNGPKPRLSIKSDVIIPVQQTPVVNITDSVADIFLKNSGKTFEALKAGIDNNSAPKHKLLKQILRSLLALKSQMYMQ